MIEIIDINKTYTQGDEQIHALKNINLKIENGEFVSIIGKSGSGKSTLLHLLGGLDSADSGKILYNNQNILMMKNKELNSFRRKHIGFIFQDYNLIPELNGEQNIRFPAMLAKNNISNNFFQMIVEKLDISDRIKHLPSEMSGGQQQRIAIARAFINKPDIILCDEPTGNLDSQTSDSVMNLIRTLKEELNQTVILVTHDLDYAQLADRVIELKDGEII